MRFRSATERQPLALPGELDDALRHIRLQSIARLWQGMAITGAIAVPLSLTRAWFTGWLPVYTLNLVIIAGIFGMNLVRHRLSFHAQAVPYLLLLWAVGLPGIATFGLSAASIWWLVLSCFVAGILYSVRLGLLLAAAVGLVLAASAWGFVSGHLTLAIDANDYVRHVASWTTLLVVTGSFVLVLLQTTGAYNQSLLRLLAELREQRDHIAALATHDQLTGLPMLRLASERIAAAFARARRGGRKVALLFIDLDGFKAVNDAHGHEAGDVVLQAVAARLQAVLRAEDTVARLGGDEFLAAVVDLKDEQAAAEVARKMLAALTAPVLYGGAALRVGASIGISLYPDHGSDYAALRKLADAAMYAVKRSGKNSYGFAPGGHHTVATVHRLPRGG